MIQELETMISDSEILLVDNNLDDLKLLVTILNSAGYHVRPTNSPTLALESALTKPPDLCLVDILMADMNGFELCRRLKQDIRTKAVPVVFVSALQDVRERLYGYEVGDVDYITKPFQAEELLARVGSQVQLYRLQHHPA
jgi:DNA-binding response OmpR family regulator